MIISHNIRIHQIGDRHGILEVPFPDIGLCNTVWFEQIEHPRNSHLVNIQRIGSAHSTDYTADACPEAVSPCQNAGPGG